MRTKQKNKADETKIMSPMGVASAPSKNPISGADYDTENHLRTLLEAHMIQSDPDKMAKVHALAGRHSKAIKSVQDLKDTYQNKFGPKKADTMANDDGDDGDE